MRRDKPACSNVIAGALLCLVASATACRGPAVWVDPSGCKANAPADVPDPDNVAYHKDIRPIIESSCWPCHTKGEMAPFALESYKDADYYSPMIRSAVHTGRMPPWHAGSCCRDYRFDTSLSQSERALVDAWVKAGTPEGNPADYTAPTPKDRGGLSKVDVAIKNPAYTPKPAFAQDELRCFLLDLPFSDTRFITGFNVVPGNTEIVHHALLNVINKEFVGHFEGLDDADAGPGWDCYGQGLSSAHGAGIGGWVPGFQGVDYPDGLGVTVPAGSKILMAVHYDLSSNKGSDQTTAQFSVAESVEREVVNLGFSHPLWLISDGMHIPAGEEDVMRSFTYDPTSTVGGGGPLKVYAVNMHMHELGKSAALAIDRANGERECLLYVPRYDSGWQQSYFLKEPTVLQPGDRLYLECHWDNSLKNQPLVQGSVREPVAQRWGSDKEMCTAFVMMAKL